MDEKKERMFNMYGGTYIENQENNFYGGTNYVNGAEPINNKGEDEDHRRKELENENEVLAVRLHGHKVDMLRVYEFLADEFVKRLKSKNRWGALKAFLKDKGLLAVEDNSVFAAQMNSAAWFGWLEPEYQCSVDALKVYGLVSFAVERMNEPNFDSKSHGTNARYKGYCELKQLYDQLCEAWNENVVLKKNS